MKQRKFFDMNDKEVKPEDAAYAVELEFDKDGEVTKSTWFFAEDAELGEAESEKGGPGSGHWAHEGRPGFVGGSKPGRGLAYLGLGKLSTLLQRRTASLAKRVGAGGASQPKQGFSAPKVEGGKAVDDPNTEKLDKAIWPYETPTMKERGQMKNNICIELSEKSGEEYESVNIMLREWAESANDANADTIQYQRQAEQLFGSERNDWQKARKPWEAAARIDEGTSETVLKTMYAHTQVRLREEGFKPGDQITLYRGINTAMPQSNKGDFYNMRGNAMESWTTRRDIADMFGQKRIAVRVPVERILSTARTGFGCLSEWEVIVLGGQEYEVYREW